MAKKKNKQAQKQPQQLSPEKYIRLKARSLPVVKCMVNREWQKYGLTHVVVVRRHAGGTYTIGFYFVDTFCVGVKDSFFKFNLTDFEYEAYIDDLTAHDCVEISYNEAHNIIYGAIAFAEEFGIKPDKTFDLMQYMLEEDTDDIPLIEYEFGKKGRPCLEVETKVEANKYLPYLKASGVNYEINISGLKEEELERFSKYPETPYTYQTPEYPNELNLKHEELRILFRSYVDFLLTKEEIDRILALPRESLIADLQHMALFQIGENDGDLSLIHILFFLGELRAEEALDTVLEVLRQDEEFLEINFGGSYKEVLALTLYYVGRNRLPDLLAFMKEPGLYLYFKFVVVIAVNFVADEPGRREEVLDWYRELLHFYRDNASDLSRYCALLGGLVISEMIDIAPVELLPEIKEVFDACLIDDSYCGVYPYVEKEIKTTQKPLRERKLMDIYERNQLQYTTWCI